MILDYLWRYPPYIILLIMVDLVSVSHPPVFLIPRSMVIKDNVVHRVSNLLEIAHLPPAGHLAGDLKIERTLNCPTTKNKFYCDLLLKRHTVNEFPPCLALVVTMRHGYGKE